MASSTNKFGTIGPFKSEVIKDLLSTGNLLSMSGLITIAIEAKGSISAKDLIELYKAVRPDLANFIEKKVEEFKKKCKTGNAFLKIDENDNFHVPKFSLGIK